MTIIAPFEAIKLSETKVGDLVRLSHSLAPLCLVIHEVNRERKVLGVLQDGAGRAPFHIVYQRDFTCFRYSAGWALDLPGEVAQYHATSPLAGVAGVVHVGTRGPVMNFAPFDNRENELTVNLNTYEWDDVHSHSAAFPQWSIWPSREASLVRTAPPIMTFKAVGLPE